MPTGKCGTPGWRTLRHNSDGRGHRWIGGRRRQRSIEPTLSDDDIRQMLDTAMEHHLAGRLADAEPIYRQVIAEHPDQPDAYHRLGMLACQAGNAERAVTLIDRAIQINPNDWRYHCGRGEVLLAVNQYTDAIAAFERALRLNGDAPEALVQTRRHLAPDTTSLIAPSRCISACFRSTPISPKCTTASVLLCSLPGGCPRPSPLIGRRWHCNR